MVPLLSTIPTPILFAELSKPSAIIVLTPAQPTIACWKPASKPPVSQVSQSILEIVKAHKHEPHKDT